MLNEKKEPGASAPAGDSFSIRFEDPIEVDDKALIRKIDWRIIPILFLTYFLQFLDKIIINYANLMSLQEDLGMEGSDFSWMATAFFIGFAVAEFPQGALLQRFSVTKALGLNVFLWGVVLCCSAACHNFAGLLACRIILGMLEAVVGPSLILITSMWYTRSESTPRYGLWYCGLGVGQIVGGLISFAAQHAPADLDFASWRIMFVAVGVANIIVAILCFFGLPEDIDKANFLTESERARVRERISHDQAGNGHEAFAWSAVWAAFGDLQTWLLCLLTILSAIPSGVITTFSAILIKGFGYTSQQSALLNMPSGIITIIATMSTSYSIIRGYRRTLVLALVLLPTILGAGLMSFLPEDNQPGCLAGIYLINCTTAPLALIYSLVGSNFSGYTKKITGSALVSASFSVANIIGPQTFQAKDAPGYIPAKVTILVVEAAAIVIVILLHLVYQTRNKLAERLSMPAMCSADRRAYESSTMTTGYGFRYVL